LIIGYALFVAIQLRNAKKHKPGAFTETYLEYLHQTRNYLLVSKAAAGQRTILVYPAGYGHLRCYSFMGFGVTGRLKPILKMALMNVVLAIVTYFLNKRGVKKEIIPRLAKVDELINVMEKA